MVVVIAISAATSFLLLVQAIYILKSGDTRMFFVPNNSRERSALRLSTRIAGSLMYGIPGCAIFALLAFAVVKNGRSTIVGWLATDTGNLVGGVILFAMGLSAVVWPDWILKGVEAAYPNADLRTHRAFGEVLVRILGAVLLGFGLLILSVVKRTG